MSRVAIWMKSIPGKVKKKWLDSLGMFMELLKIDGVMFWGMFILYVFKTVHWTGVAWRKELHFD